MASAKQMQQFAVRTANYDLLSLLIVAGSLEHIHAVQAHQPASVADRAGALVAAVVDAAQPPERTTMPTTG